MAFLASKVLRDRESMLATFVSADLWAVRLYVKPQRQPASRGPTVWHPGGLRQTEEQNRLAQRCQSSLERTVHVPG